MLRKSVLLAAAVALMLPAMAAAQPRQGDWELTLGATGASDRNFSSGAISGDVAVGTYVADQILVAFRQALSYIDGIGWASSSRVAADYHFDMDVWQPFVGANVGYRAGRAAGRDTFFVAPEGGVKYYVNNRTFIFGLIEFQWDLRSPPPGVRRGAWAYSAGVGFNW